MGSKATVIVNHADLKEFAAKVALNGLVPDCIIEAADGKISAMGVNRTRVVCFYGEAEAVVKKPGRITIPALPTFAGILSRFDYESKTRMQFTGKHVALTQKGKQGQFAVVSDDLIESTQGLELIETTDFQKRIFRLKNDDDDVKEIKFSKKNMLVIDTSLLKSLVGDAGVVGEEWYTFSISKDGKVKVSTDNAAGSARFITKLVPSEIECSQDFSMSLGFGFKEVISNCDGDVTMFFNPKANFKQEQMPVWIENGSFSYIVQTGESPDDGEEETKA